MGFKTAQAQHKPSDNQKQFCPQGKRLSVWIVEKGKRPWRGAGSCLQFPERPPGSLRLPWQNENQRMQVTGRESWEGAAKDQNSDGAGEGDAGGPGGDRGHL